MQYSVFEAVLDKVLSEKLREDLLHLIDREADRIFVYPLPADAEREIVRLGTDETYVAPGDETVFIV